MKHQILRSQPTIGLPHGARPAPPGIRSAVLALLGSLSLCASLPAWTAETPRLTEDDLATGLQELEASDQETERLGQAKGLARGHLLSSLQVKAIAAKLPTDDARLEFALDAYPRTLDPENFYEVYDAFRSFSKVFRLHDALRRTEPLPAPPVVTGPPPLSSHEMADILRVLRKESFDDTKLAAARQFVQSARGRITSKQVLEITKTFSFENAKLDFAKAAYAATQDPWNYHVVYEAFAFPSTRESLIKYIGSRSRERPEPKPR